MNLTKGFTILAQNTKDTNYIEQAYLLALSIKATQTDIKNVCLITNDTVSDSHKHVFDKIIDIPWEDSAINSDWKVENRWKIYHTTPYDETIVLDTDMIVLQDISSWWEFLDNYELFFTSNVYTYRNDLVTSDYYRKAFTENNLPNIYSGFQYFKKCNKVHEFYKLTELICNNWELFYGTFIKKHYPKRMSMDITFALAAKIMNIDTEITNKNSKYPSFVHMKPKIQNWNVDSEFWQDRVGVYLTDDLNLKIGNFTQSGIFHYTEKNFVTSDKIKKYQNYLGIDND